MINVSHFGVHFADGDIGFLIQEYTASNALGINLDCPFEVITQHRSMRCCHQIELVLHEVELPPDKVLNDPLFRAMQPIPVAQPKPLYLAQRNLKPLVSLLTQLSTPTKSPMTPVWAMTPQQARLELLTTNVQPLVITDIKSSDRTVIDTIIDQAEMSPRQLVLMGADDVRLGNRVRVIGTNLRELPYDLRQVGGRLLTKYMRKS